MDQAGGRCVGGSVPRGGQRAHAGNGRPRRLGQETALRPAPLSVPGAGRAAGPVWLRLGRFPRCGCRAGYSLLSPPPPPRSSAIQLIARLPSQFCERVWVPETPSREAGPQGRLSPSVPPRTPVAGCPRPTAPLAPGPPRSRRPRPVPGLGTRAASARTATVPFGVPRSPSPHRVPVISSSAGRFYQETLLGSDARPPQPPRPCEVLIALGSMDVVFTGFHTSSRARVPALNPARSP